MYTLDREKIRGFVTGAPPVPVGTTTIENPRGRVNFSKPVVSYKIQIIIIIVIIERTCSNDFVRLLFRNKYKSDEYKTRVIRCTIVTYTNIEGRTRIGDSQSDFHPIWYLYDRIDYYY